MHARRSIRLARSDFRVRAKVVIQPGGVVPRLRTRASVLPHSPVHPVPPPLTRPPVGLPSLVGPVAAPRTRLSLRLLPPGSPACLALPVSPSSQELPEPNVSQEQPEPPVSQELPESPARPALPESPVYSGPAARVPGPRSAARVAAPKAPPKWSRVHVPCQSRHRHRGQMPTQTLPYRFRFCGRSPHLWGRGAAGYRCL
ncbi:uncharacterized protein LOC127910575 [Oncorhynchus keta]|uniref:uncharacterized protein LOC127910575 n=1 Tax=Oncorhynchus keta TaxID=8018 RepID=UPI00227CC496|nr:uncharacterized protein LOC127910575 [Oncorhynchus keta]